MKSHKIQKMGLLHQFFLHITAPWKTLLFHTHRLTVHTAFGAS